MVKGVTVMVDSEGVILPVGGHPMDGGQSVARHEWIDGEDTPTSRGLHHSSDPQRDFRGPSSLRRSASATGELLNALLEVALERMVPAVHAQEHVESHLRLFQTAAVE